MQQAVIIPAYNAASTLATVVEGLTTVGFEKIFVINDGSNDDTFLISNKLPVILLNHDIRKGVGAALKTGLKAAKESGIDVVLTIGADNQRDFLDARKLVDHLICNKFDIVIGVKNLDKNSNVPLIRRIANILLRKIFNIRFKSQLKEPIKDCVSGFRAISSRIYSEALEVRSNGYSYDVAFLKKLVSTERKINQMEVAVKYHNDSTKMKIPLLEFIRIALEILK